MSATNSPQECPSDCTSNCTKGGSEENLESGRVPQKETTTIRMGRFFNILHHGLSSPFGSWKEKAKRPTQAWWAVAIFATVPTIVLAFLLAYFVVHLRELIPRNDIQRVVASWGQPSSLTEPESHWPTDFSRDITPIPCHSHNDYWRRVPLYDALAAGCTSVEADIWFTPTDLLVGHSLSSLTESRSLKSLYIDPLVSILTHQNPTHSLANTGRGKNGVFDTDPTTPLTLLVDIKTDGLSTFPVLLDHLEPLRSRGWLTYYNGTVVVPGLITVVGSGNTPFGVLTSNTTYRDVFFDAPMDQLWGEDAPSNATLYTEHNSFYASVSFDKAIGKPWHGILTPQQVRTIRGQLGSAKSRGLKARYWDTPAWPVGVRDHVWDVLEMEGVDVLNVDDLDAVAERNWGG